MNSFHFVDPNRRPQADVRRMTKELTEKFHAIDPDLTLIHHDNFIDYGPEVFPQLASLYWDPRVPNHPMATFVYSEYHLRYRNFPLYWFTPYGECIDEFHGKVGNPVNPDWERLKSIDNDILKVIHDYQVHNFTYWQDLFSEEQLQQVITSHYSRTTRMIGNGIPGGRMMDFTDPMKRPHAAVEKATEYLETQLDKLDSRLTLSRDESYIDFEPSVGRYLSEWWYDPEVDDPDDPLIDLTDREYQIYYQKIILYSFGPYSLGTGYHGDIFDGGIPNIAYLGLNQELVDNILKVIHEYQLFNLYYWRDCYTPEEFQVEINKYKKMWDLD